MNPYISTQRIYSYAEEFANSCGECVAKKASKDISYSSVMRKLRKSYDQDTVNKFQKEFKKLFDQEILSGKEPADSILEEAIKCISFEDDTRCFKKMASAIDLGDPDSSGKYLADLIKFLLRRISAERRPRAIENLRKKIYYLNEYQNNFTNFYK